MNENLKSLGKTGLSITQAQTISNLCFQRGQDIADELSFINNCSKSIQYKGDKRVLQAARPIPANVLALIKEKAQLHATQAFLMENLKHKDALLQEARRLTYKIGDDKTAPEYPEEPAFEEADIIPEVKEDWGWKQLTTAEYGEYLEAEAYASHIGQFFHKRSPLDILRKELPTIKDIEWLVTEGTNSESIPVDITKHHTASQLLEIHEKLAAEHREWEQKVNRIKAKVLNLVTEQNARIGRENGKEQGRVNKINADLRKDFQDKLKTYNEAIQKAQYEFEDMKNNKIKEIAAYRIQVDNRFQKIIDKYLPKEG